MLKNLHVVDQIFRSIIGIFLVAWAIAGGPFWTYLGLILIATSAWGFCPIYWVLRINRR